jgi:hypothetical protein
VQDEGMDHVHLNISTKSFCREKAFLLLCRVSCSVCLRWAVRWSKIKVALGLLCWVLFSVSCGGTGAAKTKSGSSPSSGVLKIIAVNTRSNAPLYVSVRPSKLKENGTICLICMQVYAVLVFNNWIYLPCIEI